MKDLEILKGLMSKLKSDGLLDKVQFVLCGYDLRGTMTMIDQKTGEQKQRPIKPKESVWYQYEKIFTDDYNLVSEDYKKFLLSFENKEYENVNNEPYRRVWTKSITSYATNYNLFDISLAPLKESTFNKVKSQLKVIEAGFHKKALIAQDFGPYQIDVVNAYEKGGNLNEEANGFLVPTSKNHKFWYSHLKKLILNPELITKLGENLYKTVNGTYDMKSVCENRKELYKKLISEKKVKEVDLVK
jgi:glycosyltransferase involved in cell wall biosynthesis